MPYHHLPNCTFIIITDIERSARGRRDVSDCTFDLSLLVYKA